MALPLEQKKRQKTLLIIASAILLVAAIVLYFGIFKKPSIEVISENQPSTPVVQQPSTALDAKLGKIDKLDFEFLNEKILSFLKIHGKLPVEKGTTGRENPFIPY